MTCISIPNVRLAGVAAAIPKTYSAVTELASTFGDKEIEKISANTGVKGRYLAPTNVCTSDLCAAAARQLLNDLDWDPATIDILILVTQTPDYILPATSCSLHGRLGLSKTCASFDVNLGCSGYVYGLWMGAQFISPGQMRRVLLLSGDTISKISSPRDRAVAPLFGDAGTATALEYQDNASTTTAMTFCLGTDGSGEKNLIVPAGGFRTPRSTNTSRRTVREGGNARSDEDLFMNGAEIFTFSLREVPALVDTVLQATEWTPDIVDAFVLHQANAFMLQHLARRMKLPLDKVPIALSDVGNTSSASIPLTIIKQLGERLSSETLNLVLAGFGVGYSWGAATVIAGPITVSPVSLVDDCEIHN